MDKLIQWANKKTGRRFWYSLRLEFYHKNPDGSCDGRNGSFRYVQVGLMRKSEILNTRLIKKQFASCAKEASKYHKNHKFEVMVLGYLGWFAKEK